MPILTQPPEPVEAVEAVEAPTVVPVGEAASAVVDALADMTATDWAHLPGRVRRALHTLVSATGGAG